jgi:hypothetical protein
MHRYHMLLLTGLLSLIVLAGCDGFLGFPASTYPAAPSRLEVVDPTAGATSLCWHENAMNEAFLEIQRLVDGDHGYTVLATLETDACDFTDTSTEAGKVYSYRVRAVNEHGGSGWTSAPPLSPAFVDPVGDAYGIEPFQYEITAVGFDPATSTIEIHFDGPVFPVDSPTNPLVANVEIDIDNDPATGLSPTIEILGPAAPPTNMGVEYSIDLWAASAEPDGSYTAEIIDLVGALPPRIASVIYGVDSVRIIVPSIEIDFDDGDCTVAVVVGTSVEPTDELGPIRFY